MAYSMAFVTDRTGLIVMTAFFCCLSAGVVSLRFWARRFKGLALKADDWLSLVALIFILAINGMFLAACIKRVLTGHSQVDPIHEWPIWSPKQNTIEAYKFGLQITEKPAFGFVKLSVLFLWKRIFGHVRSFYIFAWFMITFVAAWAVTFFFTTLFQCKTDFYVNWGPVTDFLVKCPHTLNVLTAFTSTDILADVVIILMPLPMIWRLQMSMRRKVALSMIFAIGCFATGAAVARMFVYLIVDYAQHDNPDFEQDITIVFLWTIIELNLAMICTCLPTLLPVIRGLPKIRSFLSTPLNMLSTITGIPKSQAKSTKIPDTPAESDRLSTTSIRSLQGKYIGAAAKRDIAPFGPDTEIIVSTAAPADTYDMEMQKRDPTKDVVVTNHLMQHDTRLVGPELSKMGCGAGPYEQTSREDIEKKCFKGTERPGVAL